MARAVLSVKAQRHGRCRSGFSPKFSSREARKGYITEHSDVKQRSAKDNNTHCTTG